GAQRAGEVPLQGVGEPRKVAFYQLTLQGDGRGGDDDGDVGFDGVPCRGDQVGQGLTRSRARLDGEVRGLFHGLGDGIGHFLLAGARRAANAADCCGEEVLGGTHGSTSSTSNGTGTGDRGRRG